MNIIRIRCARAIALIRCYLPNTVQYCLYCAMCISLKLSHLVIGIQVAKMCYGRIGPLLWMNGWLFPNYEYAVPLSLRSGHLDMEDAQCPKKMMGVRFHTISCLGAADVQKGLLGAQKFNFHQKWPNLQGRLELIWRSFFAWMTFFVRLLIFDISSIFYFFCGT